MTPTVLSDSDANCSSHEALKSDTAMKPSYSVINYAGKIKRRRTSNSESNSGNESLPDLTESSSNESNDHQHVIPIMPARTDSRSSTFSTTSGCSSNTEDDEESIGSPARKSCRCHFSDADDDDGFREDSISPSLSFHHPRHHSLCPLANNQPHPPITNTRSLIEIAMRTIKLVRRNQELQRKLYELQQETSEFIESVMANPENVLLRERVKIVHQKS